MTVSDGERRALTLFGLAGEAEFVDDLAKVIYRVEANWDRETSGPGSRFEGQRREFAQALAAIRDVRRHDRDVQP